MKTLTWQRRLKGVMVEQSQEPSGPSEAGGTPGWRAKGGSWRCQGRGHDGCFRNLGGDEKMARVAWGEGSNGARNWFG